MALFLQLYCTIYTKKNNPSATKTFLLLHFCPQDVSKRYAHTPAQVTHCTCREHSARAARIPPKTWRRLRKFNHIITFRGGRFRVHMEDRATFVYTRGARMSSKWCINRRSKRTTTCRRDRAQRALKPTMVYYICTCAHDIESGGLRVGIGIWCIFRVDCYVLCFPFFRRSCKTCSHASDVCV